MISDDDVIRLAKWHENETVRLRKHPDADMASTHGLAEMHGETASTLYMLLAERDAAIMDADMQAREAGNMEYNARVLMAERDLERSIFNTSLRRAQAAEDERDRLHGIVRDRLDGDHRAPGHPAVEPHRPAVRVPRRRE